MKRRNRRTNRAVQNTRPAAAAVKATETKIEEANTRTTEEAVNAETVIVEEPAAKSEEPVTVKQPEVKEEPVASVPEEGHASEEKEPEAAPEPAKKPRTRRTVKKEEAVKETTKKTPARRTKKATLHHYVQFAGYEVSADELDEKVKTDYEAKTGATASGEICIYIKPEEGVAYYSVNGEGSPEFKVAL